MTTTVGALPEGLVAHLTGWTGGWPPAIPATVTGNPRNAAPGWDGRVHPVTGVVDPVGRALIGVPPDYAAAAQHAAVRAGSDLVDLLRELPALLDRPQHIVYTGTFRWSTTPTLLADAGEWVDAADPVVPDWLHPFGGRVLVARDDDGRYLAGVGIKRHDGYGHELSVGTDEVPLWRREHEFDVTAVVKLPEGGIPLLPHQRVVLPESGRTVVADVGEE